VEKRDKQKQAGLVISTQLNTMKYTSDVRIRLGREELLALFDNSENLKKWQPGLKHMKHLSGEPGQEGARTRLVYEGRKGDLIMTETISKKNLPDEFHFTYRAKGVFNEVYNYFSEPEKGTTLWKSVNIFQFRGLMALMAPFMKKAFIQNTLLNMDHFKIFAETGESIN